MSGTASFGGMSNATGGSSGGGFRQSSSDTSGLTDNSLSPRRRRRLRGVFLNTSWVNRAGRRKGATMRKDIAAHLDTLRTSIVEIALSGADDREALLTKSFDQFQTTLLAGLEPVLPREREALAEEYEPIAKFADLLDRTVPQLDLIKRALPQDLGEQIDGLADLGHTVLGALVNAAAWVPESDDELTKAEEDGQLVKITTVMGDEYLVKTELPEEYHTLISDPVELLAEYAIGSRQMFDQALAIASHLNKSDQLPDVVISGFPELFKLNGQDEQIGGGGNPNAAPDPGDDAGDADLTDDAPQNPIELISRLASAITITAGSILQAQQGQDAGADADADPGTDDASGMPDDSQDQVASKPTAPPSHGQMPAHAQGQRPPPHAAAAPAGGEMPPKKKPSPFGKSQQDKFGDIPLSKILGREIEVHPSVADELEAAGTLRKANSDLATHNTELTKQMQETRASLATLEAAFARLQATPAAPKGQLFAVDKSADSQMLTPGQPDMAKQAEHIAELALVNPDAASRALLKHVHAGGGTPVIAAS